MGQILELGTARVDAATLEEVCRRYGVLELSLFGSAARNQMRPDSDLDLMVEFQPGARIGVIKFESLAVELTGLAGRTVDLVTKRGLKPWIREEALRDRRVVYAA